MYLVRIELFFALILLIFSAVGLADDVCQNSDTQAAYNVVRAKYSAAISNQENEDLLVSKYQKQDATDKGKAGTTFGSRFTDANGPISNALDWYLEKRNINALIPKWQAADNASVNQFGQSVQPITLSDPAQFATAVTTLSESADLTNAEIAQRLQQNLHIQVPKPDASNDPLNFGGQAWVTDELNLSAAKATSAVYAKEAAAFKNAVDSIVQSSACHQTEAEIGASQNNAASASRQARSR